MNFRRHPKTCWQQLFWPLPGRLRSPSRKTAALTSKKSLSPVLVDTSSHGIRLTVPVDVFSADEIQAISHTDTNNVLQTLIPSFNVARQPISDGATMIRPASLRGLPTDKTLVLVNGKRRHRAALLQSEALVHRVRHGNSTGIKALKNIEVLRDGASAQYGSDAMAGVINFILNDNSEGGSLTIDQGEFFEGDGAMTTVLGNIGLPLGDSGFVSISGEFNEADRTNRGKQYCQSWWCVDPSLPGFTLNERSERRLKTQPIKLTGRMLTPPESPKSFSRDSLKLKPLACLLMPAIN